MKNYSLMPAAKQTDEEKILDLLERAGSRKRVLLQILTRCVVPQPVAGLNRCIDGLQVMSSSVFSPAVLCSWLEDAGALERQTGAGLPFVGPEPETECLGGVEYFKVGTPEELYYVTTDAGCKVLATNDPLEDMKKVFEKNHRYQPVIQRILALCNTEGGAGLETIALDVGNDPLLKHPALYASYFLNLLEESGALTWRKSWQTTEVGREGLELLAEIKARPETEASEECACND